MIFVKDIYFYKSERIDGDHKKKDLVAVSYLNKEQIQLFDYSDTIARFKVQSLMKEAGIVGARNGTSEDGSQKNQSVRVEPDHRQVININKNTYKDSENVKFLNLSVEQVLFC